MKVIFLILTGTSLLFGAYIRDAINNTVYDDETGLTWQDDGNVSVNAKTWRDAIDYCETLEITVMKDWRLPNRNELLSITDLTRLNPAISPTFLNVNSDFYWSSSHFLAGYSAWHVYFGNSYSTEDNISNSSYVRCVRGGQVAFPISTIMYLLD